MFENWDRLAIIIVGLGVSVYVGLDGWKMWQKKRYLGVFGTALLILVTLGVPIVLIMIS